MVALGEEFKIAWSKGKQEGQSSMRKGKSEAEYGVRVYDCEEIAKHYFDGGIRDGNRAGRSGRGLRPDLI